MTNNSANSQEFQVIILAGGKGNRMYPLTEDIPKFLLPVANRPLISYQLELLERVGFSDAIVVTNTEIASDVKKYISEIHKGKIEVKFEVTKPNLGTAETLVKIKDKIKTDFIVISGDLIVTENFLFHLAHMHRTRDAALTMLLSKPPPKSAEEILRIKKEGLETEGSSDYIGITDQGRITFFSNAADLEENLTLSKSQLRTYPNFTMYTDLLDAHFYIFAKWTLDVLEKYEKQIASIKGEFIPFLVKLQFRKKLKKGGLPETTSDTQSLAMSMSSTSRNVERDNLGCFGYIMEEGFAMRVNTIPSFLDANREISKGTVGYAPWEKPGKNNFIHEGALVDPKTQVGPECVVGEGTKVGERVAIKKSTIGKHCTIAKNVKIANSVIMDYVTLLDGTSVQNSIICHNAHVGANASVTNCQVGPGYNLEAGSKVKSESLIADDSGGVSEEIAL